MRSEMAALKKYIMEKEFFTELGELLKKYNIEIRGNYMEEPVFRHFHEDHCGDTLLDKLKENEYPDYIGPNNIDKIVENL